MRIKDLKPAWQQIKLSNAMIHLESQDILSIIEETESIKYLKIQKIFTRVLIVLVITILCQGG